MSEFGLNFLPSDGPVDAGTQSALSPAQSAIKILSLNLPKFLGQSAPVDRSLIAGGQGPGAAPRMDASGMVMESLRRAMNGGGQDEFDIHSLLQSMGMGGASRSMGGSMAAPSAPSGSLTPTFSLGTETPSAPATPSAPTQTAPQTDLASMLGGRL